MSEYLQTVEWMFQQLPMYQRIGAGAFKKDLTNTLNLAKHLGNPQDGFKTIHIAGTNGKGSTSHMLASVLQEAGYKVGLYTSPHLKDFRERIKVNGHEIPEEDVVRFINTNKTFLKDHKLSFFEMTVGMAFDYFNRETVDIAVVEVGLGGRLDSTNIITPEISVITNIGLDHIDLLGDTLEAIAMEKGGIIKPGVPVVIGENQTETREVFQEIANRNNAPVTFAEDRESQDYISDLKGSYQAKNIHTVCAVLDILKTSGFWNISPKHIESGFQNVRLNTGLSGRWQVLSLSPKVICDTAHNLEGLNYVIKQLLLEDFKDLHIVMGVVNDKDLDLILPVFPPAAKYYFCRPDVPRGMDSLKLQEKARDFRLYGEVYSSVSKAYEAALNVASKEDVIFVGGSTFTVAEII